MNATLESAELDEMRRQADDAAEPSVYVVELSPPPGLPWDQQRAAKLEAERVAPLRPSELFMIIRRIEAWAWRKPGAFVAIFARKDQIGTGFATIIQAGGRSHKAVFRTPQQVLRARRRSMAVLAASMAALSLAGLAGAKVLDTRRNVLTLASRLEREASRRLTLAQRVTELHRQDDAISSIEDRGAPLEDVLADFDAAALAHAPQTPIEGFHWRPKGFGVEVRGNGEPYKAPTFAYRADKALRPDVWLWVTPSTPGAKGQP